MKKIISCRKRIINRSIVKMKKAMTVELSNKEELKQHKLTDQRISQSIEIKATKTLTKAQVKTPKKMKRMELMKKKARKNMMNRMTGMRKTRMKIIMTIIVNKILTKVMSQVLMMMKKTR